MLDYDDDFDVDEEQLMLQEENECFTEEYLKALTGEEVRSGFCDVIITTMPRRRSRECHFRVLYRFISSYV